MQKDLTTAVINNPGRRHLLRQRRLRVRRGEEDSQRAIHSGKNWLIYNPIQFGNESIPFEVSNSSLEYFNLTT